jgi:hypothetical protein
MLQMARKVDKFATDHMEANRADLERFIQTSTAQKAAFARFIDAQHSAVVKFENENPRSNLSNILS